jgi:hypothetical protein
MCTEQILLFNVCSFTCFFSGKFSVSQYLTKQHRKNGEQNKFERKFWMFVYEMIFLYKKIFALCLTCQLPTAKKLFILNRCERLSRVKLALGNLTDCHLNTRRLKERSLTEHWLIKKLVMADTPQDRKVFEKR